MRRRSFVALCAAVPALAARGQNAAAAPELGAEPALRDLRILKRAFADLHPGLFRYATAAQLGVAAFNAQGQVDPRPAGAETDSGALRGSTFFAPGAPRQLSLSLRMAFE